MTAGTPAFDRFFERSDDPWEFRTRWYEERKRASTLAALPQRRFASAFEPGCANGELAAALAPRCDRLLASDGSAIAVGLARDRLKDLPQARVEQAAMPDDWPDGRFDLIVVSELAYYLQPLALGAFIEHCKVSLAEGGTVVACHWRRPIEGCLMSGDDVHAVFRALGGWPGLAHHEEADFVLDVWSDDARSVARREGIA